jgi:hypothetical protein
MLVTSEKLLGGGRYGGMLGSWGLGETAEEGVGKRLRTIRRQEKFDLRLPPPYRSFIQ